MTNPQPPQGEGPLDPFERSESYKYVDGPEVDCLYGAVKTAWEASAATDTVFMATLSGQTVTITRRELPVDYDGIGHVITNGFRHLFRKYDRDQHAPVRTHYNIGLTSATNPNERRTISLMPGRGEFPTCAYAEREIFGGASDLPGIYVLPNGKMVDDLTRVSYDDRIHEFTDSETTLGIAAEAAACIESGTQISAKAVLEGRQLGPNSKVFGEEAIDLYESIGPEVLASAGRTKRSFAKSDTAIIAATFMPEASNGVDRVYMQAIDRARTITQIKLHGSDVQVHILADHSKGGRVSNCLVKYVIPLRLGLEQTPVELSPAERLALHAALKRQITRNNLTRVKSWA